MKATKPLLVVVLTLTLLAVALILPAAASGNSDSTPSAWAYWARSGSYDGFKLSFFGEWTPLLEYPWQAALAVRAQQTGDTTDLATGHEVMNWQSELAPPNTPPWKHNRTTDLLDWVFEGPNEDGSCKATLLFRYNTEDLGWNEVYDYGGDVYHLWVLTDNPGNGMDHVDLYTRCLAAAPEIGDDPADWGGGDPGAVWAVDLDCRGVQVVVK